jgi:hypothetical protein
MLVSRVWDEFNYKKKNSIEIYIYIYECSPHQYWMLGKKKKIFVKDIHIFSSSWTLLFKLLRIKGPIQALTSALEKCKYINFAFKPMPTIVKKECTQKNWYYFHKFIYLLYFLFGGP